MTDSQTINASNNTNGDVKKEYIGDIKFKLFDNTAPYTAQKFRQLASGVGGFSYTGTKLHRIIPNCVIQGGIITYTDAEGNGLLYEETFAGQTNDNFSCTLSFT
jgi:cyclophilin family peptidyl-prolyl cis-trans isomerase